jgi:hypothetical protein
MQSIVGSWPFVAVIACLAPAATGCHTGTGSQSPHDVGMAEESADDFNSHDVLISQAEPEYKSLPPAASADPHQRARRLDRLVDLFDAARFAAHLPAREVLWLAVGPRPKNDRGAAATKLAASRLIQEGWALDAMPTAKADDRRFVADLLHLLSLDAQPPTTVDELATQSLALAELDRSIHPRLADNLAWRRLDLILAIANAAQRDANGEHAQGFLRAGVYTRLELADRLAQGTAPASWLLRPEILLSDYERLAASLEKDGRWQTLVAGRRQRDFDQLRHALQNLPSPRDENVELPFINGAVTTLETLGPLVRIDANGHAHLNRDDLGAELQSWSATLDNKLAELKPHSVTLALASSTPSPAFSTLRSILRKHPQIAVDWAVRTERSGTLPPQVFAPLAAFRITIGDTQTSPPRVAIRLGGSSSYAIFERGSSDAMPSTTSNLHALAQSIEDGFPDEARIGIHFAQDATVEQALQLIGALRSSAPTAKKREIIVLEDATAELEPPDPKATLLVARRAWRGPLSGPPNVSLAQSLTDVDIDRLTQASTQIALCLPELEKVKKLKSMNVNFTWLDDELVSTEVRTVPKIHKDAARRLEICAYARLRPFRLQDGGGERHATVEFRSIQARQE